MMPYPCPDRQENTMMTNTENPTGEKSATFVRVAKSAVYVLISSAFFVIVFYSFAYLFSIPFSISQVIMVALVGATVGASQYLRLWASFIINSLSFPTFTFGVFAYPGWRFAAISALVFVLLLTIAAVAWRPLRSPHPRVGRVIPAIVNWFFRKLTT